MAKNTGAKVAGDYVQVLNVEGYINNREITNLPGQFLVKGSRDVLIKNKEKVVSSPGYTLVGASKTVNRRIDGSYDWPTSTGVYRSLRGYGDTFEVWYEQAWRALKSGYPKSAFEGTTWWRTDELIDVLLSVRGDSHVEEWSGAISDIASVGINTISKTGWIQGVATSTFVFTPGSPATIVKQDGGFITAAFSAGDKISISGSASNDGAYTIGSVTDTLITLIPDDVVEAETTTGAVIIKWTIGGTWAEARFFTQDDGDANNRSIIVNGISIPYTGGETTGILHVVNDYSSEISPGDIAFQEVRVYTPAAFSSNGYVADLIFTINNQIVFGSKTSRHIFGSMNSDFTDFTFSTLRIPGEGFELDLDACPTAFAKGSPNKQTTINGNFKISAGRDFWYDVSFLQTTSNDANGVSLISESTPVQLLDTAPGSAAVGQGAVGTVKNGVAVVTFEPTIDSLSNIVGAVADSLKTLPISDPIRLDIESYDMSGSHVLYANRDLNIAVPEEGIVIVYDFTNGYWQPPQYVPVSRLAMIDVNEDGNPVLCGHASSSNETYELFTGLRANGSKLGPVAAYGYENYGMRFGLKSIDEVAAEMYISASTIVKDRTLLDFMGASGILEFEIDGSDQSITFVPASTAGFGTVPEGYNPFGGAQDDLSALPKCRVIHGTSRVDFFERQRVFYSESEDAQFAIIAYGDNAALSVNEPTFIRK